jgi:dihydroorotase
VYAVKYYPAGVTTHAEHGVVELESVYPVLEAMIEQQLPLLVHGEITDSNVDIFDRERVFIERVLIPLQERYTDLRIVLEHITTREAVEFISSGPGNIAATITPHHAMLNRNAMFTGGLQPHHYCRPVLKAEKHRQAVLEAATSGNPRFFLGTDSAPHARSVKEAAGGCAGIYSAHNAIELYAEIFETAGFLDRLEAFSSFYGADFYGLPRNEDRLTLVKEKWTVPLTLPFGDDELVPFHAGGTCQWKLTQ